MKSKRHTISCASILTIALAALSCQPMSHTEHNPKAGFNGGFEHVKNNAPANWQVYPSDRDNVFTLRADTTDFKEGRQSLHIEVEKSSGKAGRFAPGIATEVALEKGKTYHMSYWIKTTVQGLRVSLTAISPKSGSALHQWVFNHSGGSWEQHQFEFRLPDDRDRLRIEFSAPAAGSLLIDDIRIEPAWNGN
jgi:hypothetical protein